MYAPRRKTRCEIIKLSLEEPLGQKVGTILREE